METQIEISSKAVRQAFRAAKVIKYSGVVSSAVLCIVVFAGFSEGKLVGCASVVLYVLLLMSAGLALSKRARCPKCKIFWHCRMGFRSHQAQAVHAMLRPNVDLSIDETVDLKCRRCGLEIGPYLKV